MTKTEITYAHTVFQIISELIWGDGHIADPIEVSREEMEDLLVWVEKIDPDATYETREYSDSGVTDVWRDYTFSDGSKGSILIVDGRGSGYTTD